MNTEAGRKRERPMETEQSATRRRASASKAVAAFFTQARESSAKLTKELRLKRAVARRNQENPGGEPIVAEDLTEQERAALLQEEEERERIAQRERSDRRIAEMLAAEAEWARAPPLPDPIQEDRSEQDYSEYRPIWDKKWSSQYGSFEDITPIPCMCFTDNPMPRLTSHPPSTVQIFSVKVAEIAGDLQWPLDVFGTVAMRDDLDHNRNIIFRRTRDNCQTLIQEDPYLVLTGPSRAVVHRHHGSVYIDAVLKVKGSTESEDRDLSLLIRRFNRDEPLTSFVCSREYTSKLSTLELAYGIIVSSVEATITVRVVEGSWPDRLRGQFTACTASAPRMKVSLLDSRDEVVAVTDDGTVELSRRVVSVEMLGELIVSAVLSGGSDLQAVEAEASFAPMEFGRSHAVLDVGLCKMRVTVAWSPILKCYPIRGFSPACEAAAASGSSSQIA